MLETLCEAMTPTPVLSFSGDCSLTMESPVTAITSLEAVLSTQTCIKTNISKSSKHCAMEPSERSTKSSHYKSKTLPATLDTSTQNLRDEISQFQTNLFQAGFEDCASEVVRFLVQQEQISDCDPLVQGLQTHLRKMSHTICPENIAELDDCHQHTSSESPDVLNSKLLFNSDNKEPDNKADARHHLQDSQHRHSEYPLLLATPQDLERLSGSSKKSSVKRKRPTDEPSTLSSSSCSDFTNENTHFHTKVPKWQHASSVPEQCLSSSKNSVSRSCPTDISSIYTHDLSSPISHTSSVCTHLSSPAAAAITSYLPSSSSSSPLSLSSSSSSPEFCQTPTVLQSLPFYECANAALQPDCANPSSVLELKANFLPGIDTSSMASGNFADILLAVESCQRHENSRVRELADTIINLIHNTDEDEEDDEEEEFDEEEAEEEKKEDTSNGDGVSSNFVSEGSTGVSELEDSGVDLGEDVFDWCSPANIIEL